jgi:mannosyl-3-phosphoglycerate phosphatase
MASVNPKPGDHSVGASQHPIGPSLVVFTDLDGTLLDHQTYDWAPARPALRRLRALGCPVVPVTSKTLSEAADLLPRLQLWGPVIVEGGAGICLPQGSPGDPTGPRWRIRYRSPPYGAIRAGLGALRRGGGYAFTGFGDMAAVEVAQLTGLSLAGAIRARARLASEPILWRDSSARLAAFRRNLANRGLALERGGRFLHVAGLGADKGSAVRELVAHWLRTQGWNGTTVALGDSPNDMALLRAADIAVVVRNPAVAPIPLPGHRRTWRTREVGPAGWNEAIEQILATAMPVAGREEAP